VAVGRGCAYRFGSNQLNIHGPGADGEPNAEPPVAPGGADLCFVWDGAIDEAVAHLERLGVEGELGPVQRFGAPGCGDKRVLPRSRRSLLELIAYA
jgi:hypothetical protein